MKDVIRYSESFKMQVVREIEEGRHPNCLSAAKAYGIRGSRTVYNWVFKYGRASMSRRILRVETKDETNELERLRKEVKTLKNALAEAHLDLRLGAAFLEIACGKAGIEDIEDFKKKADMMLSTGHPSCRTRKGW